MSINFDKIFVIKKDGSLTKFDDNKIRLAVGKSASRVNVKLTDDNMDFIVDSVKNQIVNNLSMSWSDVNVAVSSIHNSVMDVLSKFNHDIYMSYKSYRDYKIKFAQAFQETAKFSEQVIYSGYKENANKDSSINSTKQALISEDTMKQLMRNFELKKEWVEAHEVGFIHIHDMGSRYLNQINCCLFDMNNVLDGGFEMNGVKYTEPNSIQTAWNVIGDITLNASSQQYGGFTIPEIDTILSKYAFKSFKAHNSLLSKYIVDPHELYKKSIELTVREIRQGYQGFEHKLNTVSNALGQTPFVTITFGADTSVWGSIIAEAILDERTKGMGVDGVTAIFPKLVFLSRKEINGEPGSPNYHLFEKAIQCSRTRLYPDYLSFDNPDINNLARIYEETGKFVSPMGCRAFLSRAKKPNTNEEVYTGRNNIGAVSLNIPMMALEAIRHSIDEGEAMYIFESLIKKYSDMVWDIHMEAYEKIGKMKGSTNPLLFCEGGSWMSVGYDEAIKPIIELSTASLGYVGLEEAANAFLNEFGGVDIEEFKMNTILYLEALTNKAKEKYGKLFALYGTPAESLVYRFQQLNHEEYGDFDNVTDCEYLTNSFHVHVTKEIDAVSKIAIEAPYHPISNGGRISYTEFPYGIEHNVLRQVIKYAMSKGLYYGVNVVSSSCCDCGHKGEFSECPKCGSDNVTVVVRVCGYLTFKQTKGDTRLNKGKMAETHDRVKHTYI